MPDARRGPPGVGALRLAVIGPSFFGYLEWLCAELERRGIAASFHDERPSNAVVAKLALRLAPQAAGRRASRAHHRALTDRVLASGATHVLLVSPEIYPRRDIVRLRAAGLRLCRYAWDSVANKPHAARLDDLLDAVASFDPADCRARGYVYVPLYSRAAPEQHVRAKTETDFFYCGTLHSNRPARLAALARACRRHGWSLERMLYYPSRPLWLARYAHAPRVWPLARQVGIVPFPLDEIYAGIRRARVVIDIHHPRQSGLTMRTFEALSLGATLLSTNPEAGRSLPPALAARVVRLGPGAPDRAMRQALGLALGPLPPAAHRFLSAERFFDQLLAFLRGDPASAVEQIAMVPPEQQQAEDAGDQRDAEDVDR